MCYDTPLLSPAVSIPVRSLPSTMLTIYHNDFTQARGGAAPFIAAVTKGLKAMGITPTFKPIGNGSVNFPVDETKRSIGMVFFSSPTRMDSGSIGFTVESTFPLWTDNPQAPYRHPIVVVTKSDNPLRLFRETNFHTKMAGILTSAYCLPQKNSKEYVDEAPIEVYPDQVDRVCKAIKEWMDIPMDKLAPPAKANPPSQPVLTDVQMIDEFSKAFYSQPWESQRDLVGYVRAKPIPTSTPAPTEQGRILKLHVLPPRQHVIAQWIIKQASNNPDPVIAERDEALEAMNGALRNFKARLTVPLNESAIQQQVDAKVKDLTTQIERQQTTIADLTAKLKKAEETKPAPLPLPQDPTSTKEYKDCYTAWGAEKARVVQLTQQLEAQKLTTDSVVKAQAERLQKDNEVLKNKIQEIDTERHVLADRLAATEARLTTAVEWIKKYRSDDKFKSVSVPVTHQTPAARTPTTSVLDVVKALTWYDSPLDRSST